MSKSQRRSFFTILFGKNPSRWGRVLILFFLVVALQGLICFYIFRAATARIPLLETPHPELADEIVTTIFSLGWFFAVTIVGLSAVCMFLVHHVTVHVLGAKTAILRYIEQLKGGRYEPSRSLRADDELKDILISLEELAIKLKAKSHY